MPDLLPVYRAPRIDGYAGMQTLPPILWTATSDSTSALQVEDGLLHFTWRQRTATGPSGEPEVDVMFVPGAEQVTFRAVSQLPVLAAVK